MSRVKRRWTPVCLSNGQLSLVRDRPPLFESSNCSILLEVAPVAISERIWRASNRFESVHRLCVLLNSQREFQETRDDWLAFSPVDANLVKDLSSSETFEFWFGTRGMRKLENHSECSFLCLTDSLHYLAKVAACLMRVRVVIKCRPVENRIVAA